MKLRKVLWKVTLSLIFVVEGFIGILVLYFTMVLGGMAIFVNNDFQEPGTGGVEIMIISNGVHTDLGVPVQHALFDWSSFLPVDQFEKEIYQMGYVGFGWGDKGFYLETPTWADLKASTALKAMFWYSPTAMHVTVHPVNKIRSARHRSIRISEKAYIELCTYIQSAFKLNGNNTPQLIEGAGYDNSDDLFFEAKGSYHCFKTCNCWTNRGLKTIGVQTPLWAPFEPALFQE